MHLADAVVVILCLELSVSTRPVSADGFVGCLFSDSLCNANIEWCFDDYAFGRCLPRYENENDLDLYQYDLTDGSLRLLKQELERLISLDYKWSHFYTQCVLRALLNAFRYNNEYNENSCGDYAEEDQKLSLPYDDDEILAALNSKDFGRIQFAPDLTDTPDLNDIYIPVYGKEEGTVFPYNSEVQSDENYSDLQRALLSNLINKNKRSKTDDATIEAEIQDEMSPNYLAYLNELASEETPNYAQYPNYFDLMSKLHFTDRYNTPDHFRAGFESKDNDRNRDESFIEHLFENSRNILKSFSKNYNTPEKFRKGHETKDEVFYSKLIPVMYINEAGGYFTPEERQLAYDSYNNFENEEINKNLANDDGVYTEGGVVYPRDESQGESSSNKNPLDELIRSYNNGAFKRPERLDVKKPGPSFNINNFAFKKEKDNKGDTGIKKEPDKSSNVKVKEVITQLEKKKVGSPMESPILRRQTTTVAPLKEKSTGGIYNGYAYITFKNRIYTWQEGSRIIRKIEDILGLNPNTFSNVEVGQNEIKFRVDRNFHNKNASDVVKGIENNKDLIQRAIGLEVTSAGVGEQNKLPTSMSLFGRDERQMWILSFLLCGVIAAVAVAGTALLIMKRYSHTKDKLQNLSQLDSEASKDYQDLCRARMATKSAQDKPEGNTSGHRVTNLTKESEGSNHSPSSRSSTSSWSEEPVLTNMDISTGHMVLSYMEDHLKNKDRLEQEWIALCAYEAEPCATTIAVKEENSKKNRYSDVLPYDHARVILNELSNISGSDYINASTITDHDPRNPAYIATQGPLPNTAADFWQMVWEQGSVVMVMLTRLTENGTAMCHRYWPEEGSELYHIYEVHLVSEHIWCDDYLVRSFYLKNLKTGETRTVTQFHFLSWPENGIPLSTKALLEFRRKVNKSYRGRSCPIVVHCSDGVGRTGTYCLIDMVLNRMAKGAKEIDIAATLEHIRDQRPLMVRTKQQFEFVLMAVAEEVHAILKALPTNPNHSPPPVLKEKE